MCLNSGHFSVKSNKWLKKDKKLWINLEEDTILLLLKG